MAMNYFKIDLSLDDNTKTRLIQDALSSDDYYYHSTKSGRYTNLDFLPRQYDVIADLFITKPHMMSLLKIEPNKLVDWHTDNKDNKRDAVVRDAVVIFPLTKNYAPCTIEEGDIPCMDCYAFNTQSRHKVQNNSETRISLQLFYDMNIEELCRIHTVENQLIHGI